jgi:hypothetical protein
MKSPFGDSNPIYTSKAYYQTVQKILKQRSFDDDGEEELTPKRE